MKHFFLILLIFISHNLVLSQDTNYVKKVVSDLCSRKMAGRGYVENGDKKAAKYIINQFKKIGLKPIKGSYSQSFQFPVNTFPKAMEVRYNGKLLKPGEDYIVNPDCPATYFKGKIEFVNNEKLIDSAHYDANGYSLKNVVVDTFHKNQKFATYNWKKYSKDFKKNIVFKLTNDKLTFSTSFYVSKTSMIILKSSVFDRNKEAFFEIKIQNKFIDRYTSQNVFGMIEGTKMKDSFVVFTAHYDHLGTMGKKSYFPGANDNASGVAMMLCLAQYFVKNPQPYSLVFIGFSGEEIGLIGSEYFVKNPLIEIENIRFLINIDLMGNGAEGVMAVNGATFTEEYTLLNKINDQHKYLPEIKKRGKAANSDHYHFVEAGVYGFFFYLMGPYPYYHDIFDTAKAIPLTNFNNAYFLFRDFIIEVQKLPQN